MREEAGKIKAGQRLAGTPRLGLAADRAMRPPLQGLSRLPPPTATILHAAL